MSSKKQVLDLILAQGVLPLYFYADPAVSVGVLQTLYHAGIRAVEYTNRGAAALENFRELIRLRNAELPGMRVGIGTIKRADQAAAFMEAGADFLVSPGMVPEVADQAGAAGLLYIPGAMTATEIIMAENAGCTFVKLFPGHLLGPGFVTAIRDLFPDMQFMVTGGVEVKADSIRSWFDAGVKVVGLGSKVIARDTMDKQDYATISSLITKSLDIVRNLNV